MTLSFGSGYAQGLLGYSWLSGPFATAEVGVRPLPGVSVYAKAQWDKKEPWAGLGAKWEW